MFRAASSILLWVASATAVTDETLPPVPEVQVSVPSGFYEAPIRVELSTDSGTPIRFTLDGREPTDRVAREYSQAIAVDRSCVLRACTSTADGRAGPVATRSYLFLAQTADQQPRPAGYPTRFTSIRKGPRRPHEFDWALDPEIVSAVGIEGLTESLASLPSLSLAVDPAHLSELYTEHSRRGVEWERPVSVELLYPAGGEYESFRGFRVDCGLRMQGGLAVDQARKKSFRLLFKRRYGAGKLHYPVFESAVWNADSAVERFDTLILRAGGNANWSKDDAYKHEPTTYLRDQLIRDTAIEMSGLGARGVFVHLWINGLYGGLYNLCERPDTDFLASYLGGRAAEWCSVNHRGLVSDEPRPWDALLAALGRAERRANREERLEVIDRTALVDYLLLSWTAGTGDWPWNNWYAGLPTGTRSEVRQRRRAYFIHWDAELSFWNSPRSYHTSSPVARVHPHFARSAAPLCRVWRLLLRDAAFRRLVGDRAWLHTRAGGALSDASFRRRFDALAARIDRAIFAESARWGDAAWGREEIPRTYARDWRPQCDAIRGFFPGNAERLLEALRREGLFPSLRAPTWTMRETAKDRVVCQVRSSADAETWLTLDGSDPIDPATSLPRSGALRVAPGDTRELQLDGHRRLSARSKRGEEWSALAEEGVGFDPSACLEIEAMPRQTPEDEGDAREFIRISNRSDGLVELTACRLTAVRYRFPPGTRMPAKTTWTLRPDRWHENASAEARAQIPWDTYRGHVEKTASRVALLGPKGETWAAWRPLSPAPRLREAR